MKRSDKWIRVISLLVFLAVVCYIGYTFYDRRVHPLRTAPAEACTVEDTIDCQGYVVRDEVSFSVQGEYTGFEAKKGEHVHKGQPVAAVYDTQAACMRAAQRRELMLTCGSLDSLLNAGSLRSAVYENIIALNRAVRDGDGDALSSATIALETLLMRDGGEIDEAALRALLSDAREQIAQIDRLGSSDTNYIEAAEAGLFCPDCDGFESVGSSAVRGISPTELARLFFEAGDGDARIVTGHYWYYAAVMPWDQIPALKEKDRVWLRFETVFLPLPVTVAEIGLPDVDGLCVVLFRSDTNMNEVLDLRFENAAVITDRSEGFRVPAEAVQNDGSDFIYVISGLQARRVDVTVLASEGGQAVVSSESALLYSGVEVIVRGSGLYDGKVVG